MTIKISQIQKASYSIFVEVFISFNAKNSRPYENPEIYGMNVAEYFNTLITFRLHILVVHKHTYFIDLCFNKFFDGITRSLVRWNEAYLDPDGRFTIKVVYLHMVYFCWIINCYCLE